MAGSANECRAWRLPGVACKDPTPPRILTTQHHRACRVVELGGLSRPYRDKQVLYCAVRPCARLLCDAVRLGWPPPASGRRPLLRVCHTAPACVCLAGRQDSHDVGLRWRLPCPGNRFLCFPDKSALCRWKMPVQPSRVGDGGGVQRVPCCMLVRIHKDFERSSPVILYTQHVGGLPRREAITLPPTPDLWRMYTDPLSRFNPLHLFLAL